MHFPFVNPFVPQAIQRSEDSASDQSVGRRGRNAEGQRSLGDRVGQRFGGD
jgi:hypothetical protein